MTINNVARNWDLQQNRITNIAANQERKDSDSQDNSQNDGGTISAFPEETGYAIVFFPDTSIFGKMNLEQKGKTFCI